MKGLTTGVLLLSCSTLSACSNQFWYDSFQNHGKHECSKKPTKQEYDNCMEQFDKPYKEYEKDREEAISN